MVTLARHTTFTPLGIRFWDPARDAQVADGLQVTAWPAERPDSVTPAFRTASGIYAFQGLSGLRTLEQSAADTATLAASPPETTRFIVHAADRRGRFLPAVFSVDLPLPARGVYPLSLPGSPPEDAIPGFYLFSAATRAAPAGTAAVRAHLLAADTRLPAAYAVLELAVLDQRWYGVADESGQVAVIFPTPPFAAGLAASPPGDDETGPAGPPPADQNWALTAGVRYEPDGLHRPAGAPLPDYPSLFSQAAGLLWETEAGPATAQRTFTLFFGQELVMRTSSLPTLWISPAGSPP